MSVISKIKDIEVTPGVEAVPAVSGEVVKPPRVSRHLGEPSERAAVNWLREIAEVYRAMRQGRISTSEGTRLIYAATAGSKACVDTGIRLDVGRIRESLTRMEGGSPPLAHDLLDAPDVETIT